MHPSQDFCTSRGLTLDETTKQCVTPPQRPPETTGSLPTPQSSKPQPPSAPPFAVPVQTTGTPPPPQEHLRAGQGVAAEPDAVVDPQYREDSNLMYELAHFVRGSGYRCDSISELQPISNPRGFKLVCNRSAYKYVISGNDGSWTVALAR